MAWAYLALAAVFEVAFVVSMKASKGFTVPWASAATLVGVVAGIGFLTLALRTLPISIGYPIWVGAGAVGSVLFGALLFGEAFGPAKLACIVLIVAGVAGLKVVPQA